MTGPNRSANPGLRSIISDFRAMLRYKELNVLNFSILVSMIGFGLIVPFLPIYAEDFGASDAEIGLMVGLFAITRLVFSPIGGWMADRIGRKPSMVIGMFLYCIVMFLFALAETIPELFLYRGLQGAASGLMWPVAMTYIGDVVEEEDRGKAMALYSLMFATGTAIGPILGGAISTRYDLAMAFYITSVLALISAFLLLTKLKESHKPARRMTKTGIRNTLGEFRLKNITTDPKNFMGVTMGSFSVFFGVAVLYPMLPIFGKNNLSLDNWEIGVIFTLMGVVQAVFMFPAGVFGDRLGRRNLIIVGCLISAIFSGLIPFSSNLYVLLVIVCIYTFGRSIARPLFPAMISAMTMKETRGKGLGVYTMAQNLAFASGATAGGYVSEIWGREYPFYLAAIVGLLGTLILFLSVNERIRVKKM